MTVDKNQLKMMSIDKTMRLKSTQVNCTGKMHRLPNIMSNEKCLKMAQIGKRGRAINFAPAHPRPHVLINGKYELLGQSRS